MTLCGGDGHYKQYLWTEKIRPEKMTYKNPECATRGFLVV